MTDKVVINLATGLEDEERVMIAFLVAVPAAEQGKKVLMFMTKDAVHLGVPGVAKGTACEGCPPIERLFDQFTAAGGELMLCPICVNARNVDDSNLVPNARVGGATPLWEWIGDDTPVVFSY